MPYLPTRLLMAIVLLPVLAQAQDFHIADRTLAPVPKAVAKAIHRDKDTGADAECKPVGKAIDIGIKVYAVTTANGCEAGMTSAGPLWLVREDEAQPKIVYSDGGYAVTLEKETTNGLRNLTIQDRGIAALWTFDGQRYVKADAKVSEADESGKADAVPLRLWNNRKHPPITNPIFVKEMLLGGWSGKGWTSIDFDKVGVITREDPAERVRVSGLFEKGAIVRFFGKGRRVGQARAREVIHVTENMYGDRYLHWPQLPKGASVGLAGAWNPFPRKAVRGDRKAVKNAVIELLSKHGVRKPGNPAIRRVEQVDVDNDGVEDFMVIAKRRKAYQLIAIITPEKNRSITVRFSKDEDEADHLGLVELFDANGDGKLEIVVEAYGMESYETVLYELRDDKAERVLEVPESN